MNKSNPRSQNGNTRRKHRARFKAMQSPCGICHGRLGPIHYDEPSDAQHPLSFVIDEIIPVSRYRFGGYSSPAEAAQDWSNLQAAHYICNSIKGNRLINNINVAQNQSGRENRPTGRPWVASGQTEPRQASQMRCDPDGDW